MSTTLHLNVSSAVDISRAAELLRAGKRVAFPTETVYGLGANALSAEAVASIFAAKERPAWDPLIVHIAKPEQLEQVADVPEELRERVSALVERFWPGPLTLLLPRRSAIPDAVTAGRPLVGVRIPAHPIARKLLEQTGLPIAAPSANTFGHTSPTTAAHVLADLDGRIEAVLDGGPATVGLESTVLDPASMTVYRPGAVTLEQIEEVVGVPAVLFRPTEKQSDVEPTALPSPGVGIRHYAPRARLVLTEANQKALETAAAEQTGRFGVLLPAAWQRPHGAAAVFEWGEWNRPETLAARLFAGLRQLDEQGVEVILCPLPEPQAGLHEALRDRLLKAAREK